MPSSTAAAAAAAPNNSRRGDGCGDSGPVPSFPEGLRVNTGGPPCSGLVVRFALDGDDDPHNMVMISL